MALYAVRETQRKSRKNILILPLSTKPTAVGDNHAGEDDGPRLRPS
jgi:hypothetical protein